MIRLQRLIKKSIRLVGFDLIRYAPSDEGGDSYIDIKHHIVCPSPTIFDIGSHQGESIESFLSVYPLANIYSFEPSLYSFAILSKKYSKMSNIRLYCEGLGDTVGAKYFMDNEFPFMSSFLELGHYGYGNIINRRRINVNTLGRFIENNNIEFIDILKIDVQGYEFQVLSGCSDIIQEKVKLILVELTFTNMYEGLPNFQDLISFLIGKGFILCGIYRQHFQQRLLSWADALFVNKAFI